MGLDVGLSNSFFNLSHQGSRQQSKDEHVGLQKMNIKGHALD